jgi:hypothetical protein
MLRSQIWMKAARLTGKEISSRSFADNYLHQAHNGFRVGFRFPAAESRSPVERGTLSRENGPERAAAAAKSANSSIFRFLTLVPAESIRCETASCNPLITNDLRQGGRKRWGARGRPVFLLFKPKGCLQKLYYSSSPPAVLCAGRFIGRSFPCSGS